jgi:lysophospholipase L1-like esterase
VTTSELSARASLAHTRSLLSGGQPVRILILGDSIANGAGADRWEHSFVALWIEHLRGRYEAPIRFANVSFGGRTSGDGLPIAASTVLDVRPDLVVIAFGVNDQKAIRPARFRRPRTIPPERFKRNVEAMAKLVQARVGADVILVAPCLLPVATKSRLYRDALAELAAERGFALADPLAFWHDGPELIAADGVHPSAAGHRLYADALIEHLDL